MNRFRPLLCAVLGLVLLVQGFAVAAAEYRAPESSPMPAEASLPCHGQAAGDTQDEGVSSCCDAGCPDMTSCALGHMALAPAAVVTPVIANESLSAEPIRLRSSSAPPTFLRPPIVSRA